MILNYIFEFFVWFSKLIIHALEVVQVPNFLLASINWIFEILTLPIVVFKTFVGWDWSTSYLALFVLVYGVYLAVKIFQFIIKLGRN